MICKGHLVSVRKTHGFKLCGVEVENTTTGKRGVIEYSTGMYCSKWNVTPCNVDKSSFYLIC